MGESETFIFSRVSIIVHYQSTSKHHYYHQQIDVVGCKGQVPKQGDYTTYLHLKAALGYTYKLQIITSLV